MTEIKNNRIEKGLYEVKIERTNVLFNSWMGNLIDVETVYMYVYDCKAFEKWLNDMYADDCGNGIKYIKVTRIDYKKVSEDLTILD